MSLFPNDAITKFYHFTGAGSYHIASGDTTTLRIYFKQGNVSSDTQAQCNGSAIAYNFSTDYSDLLSYHCSGSLDLVKTGQDELFASITYVPYNIASVSVSPNGISTTGGFSYGEIVISFFLFCLLVGATFMALKSKVVKIKKDYIDYD